MNSIWIAIIFVGWYVAALVVSERLDKKSSIGKQWLFFISFIFSPFAAVLVVSLGKKR
jgi:ABC-type iron transport system FetAB permease component